jgi:hypothetical protein
MLMVPVRVSLAVLITAVVGVTMSPGAASADRAPSAATRVYALLGAVSCPSSAECFADGWYLPGGRGQISRPLIEQFNGTRWRVSPAAMPAARSSELLGISCVSTTNCIAVGQQTLHALTHPVMLAEHWDGKTWSITPTPVPPNSLASELLGVSCARSGPCMAVGDQNFGTINNTTDFAELWNGTRWTEIPAAQPANAGSLLIGVSCRIASDCTATGWWNPINNNSQSFPLVNHWDGTRWTVVPSPHPASLNDSILSGVACPAPGNCVAVGDFFTKTPTTFLRDNLSELWNGTRWSRLHTPEPTGSSENQLNTLSCPAAGSCMAVGGDVAPAGPFVTLAEHWNGQRWSILSTPGSDAELDSVSCPQLTLCVATGEAGAIQGIVTLAEVWQGGKWRIVPSPSP